MISPLSIVLAVLPVYLIIGGGAIARKSGLLKEGDEAGLLKIVFHVLLPCFILDRMLGAEALRDTGLLITGVCLGFGGIAIGILLSYAMARLGGLKRGSGARTFALSTGCQNFGFAAVPVTEILWGTSAVAVLFVHNVGVEAAIWSIGIMLLSGEKTIAWRRLFNGAIVAVILSLILILLRIDHIVTGPLRGAISMLGLGAFPLAIFLAGASMASFRQGEPLSIRLIINAVIIRLLLLPIVILGAAYFLPIPPELKQVLLVQAAMPAAMTPILLASAYGGRPSIATQVVIATTVISLFTLPYVITFGIKLLELTPITR